MSSSFDSIFKKAIQLFREGQYKEVDVELSKIDHITDKSEQEKRDSDLLKLQVLIKQKKNEKALIYSGSLLSAFSGKNSVLDKLRVSLTIIEVHLNLRELEDAERIIVNAEKILAKHSKSQEYDVLDLNARLEFVKGLEFLTKSLYDKAISHLERSLDLYIELGDKYKIALTQRILGTNLFYLGKFEDSRNIFDTSLEIFKEYKARSEIASIYYGISGIYYRQGELSQALEFSSKSLTIREEIGNQSEIAGAVQGLAYIYSHMGDLDKGLENLRRCKMIYEKLGLKHEVAKCLMDIHGNFKHKGEYDRSLATIFDYYSLKKELKDDRCLGIAHGCIGVIYEIKGEFDEALENYTKALEILTEFETMDSLSDVHYFLGTMYNKLSENELSLKHQLQALEIRKTGQGGRTQGVLIAFSLKGLIELNLELDNRNTAEKYFEELKEVADSVENKVVSALYKLSEGLIYRHTTTMESQTRAGIIFEEIAQERIIDHEITVEALLNLADILLWKYSKSENDELLKEIKNTVMNLESIASENNSYSLLAETYFLHAQIALMELDTTNSKELLGNALKIAEDKGLNKMAIKISNEYDNFLDKLDLWEDFTLKLPSIAEKMELTHIEKQLNNVIKGRLTVDAEIESELPVLFLMMDQNERILYSEQYGSGLSKEQTDKVHYDITNIIKKESVIERVHRTRIQEFNCILRNEFGISMCYLFIGKSYSGAKKLSHFVNLINDSKDIRDKLEIASVSDQTLSFTDRIKLTEILDEILANQNSPISQ